MSSDKFLIKLSPKDGYNPVFERGQYNMKLTSFAVLKLVKGAMKDAWCWGIFGLILVLSFVLAVSPILYVLAAGLAGVVLQAVKGREKK